MTQTLGTTIPAVLERDLHAHRRQASRMPWGSSWLLVGLAATAVVVLVTLLATATNNDVAEPSVSSIVGQPATSADLVYAAEWANRVNHLTTNPVVIVGQPATSADLAYAAEWANRVNHLTTDPVVIVGQPATSADLAYAAEWANRVNHMTTDQSRR